MAGRGRRVLFHGAFTAKADAVRKEREVGGFIRPAVVRGSRRFMVLTRRDQAASARQRRNPEDDGGAGWLWLLLLGGGLRVLSGAAPAPSVGTATTAWVSDEALGGDGAMIVGASIPDDCGTWRLATQEEIRERVGPAGA
jgi:hypothetical protein